MMEASRRMISPVADRINLASQLARVLMTSDNAGLLNLQVRTGFGQVINDVPFYQTYGRSVNPPPGSQVFVACLAGLGSKMVALAADAPDVRVFGLQPGETCDYTDEGVVVLNKRGRAREIHCKTLTVFADESVTFQSPIVNFTGDVIDHSADGTGRTMAQMRNYDINHTHKNVQPGHGSSGNANEVE